MTYINHKDHTHPSNSRARAKCRRMVEETGQPWDGTTEVENKPEEQPEELTRGQKAAATRKRNAALETQAKVVDSVLLATEEPRDDHGRFVRLTLDEWRTIIEDLENAQEWLIRNATLESARLEMTVGGSTLIATFDGHTWSVGGA